MSLLKELLFLTVQFDWAVVKLNSTPGRRMRFDLGTGRSADLYIAQMGRQ